MTDRYEEIYYHFVWATKDRAPYINAEIERPLYKHINLICDQFGIELIALNGTPDHIHVACSVPTRLSISAAIKNIKARSSHYINNLDGDNYFLAWQPGYGVLTISKSQVSIVAKYIQNQKRHHELGTTKPMLERTNPIETHKSP